MKNLVFKVVLIFVLIFTVSTTVISAKEYQYTVVKGSIGGSWDPFGNPPDTYVYVFNKATNYSKETGVVQDSNNPVWNFSSSTGSKYLKFAVWDKDARDDDYIGRSKEINLSDLSKGEEIRLSCGQATIWLRRDK